MNPKPGVRALHVAVLAAFAISQPLFDIVARHVEFLVAHHVDAFEIAWIAIGVGWLLPGLIAAAAWLGGRLANAGSRWIQAGFVAGSTALIALPGLPASGADAAGPGIGVTLGLALGVGWVAALAYDRSAVVRRFVTVLAPVLLVFPALFVWKVAGVAADDGWRPTHPRTESDASVFVVVFDALASNSLLDASGEMDASRHPNLASLASQAHWFFQTTAVAERTTDALPAILSGRYPRRARAATASEYPQNLFTLLAPGRSLNVVEPFTRLCPAALCERTGTRLERFEAISSDLATLYLRRLLPDSIAASLPDVTSTWKDFVASGADGFQRRRADAGWIFDRFLERVDATAAPALHFIHLNLPHPPYRYLPSGLEYGPIGPFANAHGARKGVWGDSAWEVAQAHQRHLLQLQYADTLLGRLLDRLHESGRFDAALIVVTADHGISFRPGGSARQIDRHDPLRNAADILRVPLLVKLPGQSAAVRSNRNVESIDILPTIVDTLGGLLSEPVDGISAFAPAEAIASRSGKRVFVRAREGREELRLPDRLPLGVDVLTQLGTNPERGLFDIGPHPQIHGRPVEAFPESDRSGFEMRLIDPASYLAFDPESGFVPAHVTGELVREPLDGEPRELAVAVNGVVRATTRTFDHRPGRASFSAMLDPEVFRPGRNEISIFAIRSGDGVLALESTSVRPALEYFGVPGADGRIEAIGTSDGRLFPMLSHAVEGHVESTGVHFEGEAVDSRRGRAADVLLVFSAGAFLHAEPLAPADPDAEAPKHRRFQFAIPFGRLDGGPVDDVQFVGLARDAASRLRSGRTGLAWPGPTRGVEWDRRDGVDGLRIGDVWVAVDARAGVGAVSEPVGASTKVSGWLAGRPDDVSPALLVFVGAHLARAIPIEPRSAAGRVEFEFDGLEPAADLRFVALRDGRPIELARNP